MILFLINKKTAIYNSCFFLTLFLFSCSTTNSIPNVNPTLENQTFLEVPFFSQKTYQCGPSSLASILNYRDIEVSPDVISQQVFTPGKKGSLQVEIKAALRGYEILPYQLDGNLNNLLTEINAGNPVLVLQNLSYNWIPQWHYVSVTGYDLQSNTLILHSGVHKNYKISINTFMRTWERANYWALVPVPPDVIPATANQASYNRASTSLEATGHRTAAFKAYQKSLEKWPDNDISLIGVGNYYYSIEDYQKALEAFLRLAQYHPENPVAWNNLAYVLHKRECFTLADEAILQAIKLANDPTPFIESKNELMNTQGKNSNACSSISLNY